MLSRQEIAMKEYELVCANLESRSARILTIKGWSITITGAGLATSVQVKSDILLFIVCSACVIFWILEAGLQGSQRTLSLRARELEVFLNDDTDDVDFKTPWTSLYRAGSPTAIYALRRAFLPKVFVPAGLVGLVGLIFLGLNGFYSEYLHNIYIWDYIKNSINLLR